VKLTPLTHQTMAIKSQMCEYTLNLALNNDMFMKWQNVQCV